jgi:hypothetical protein
LARFKRKDSLGYHLYLNRPNTDEYRVRLAEFGIDLSARVNELIEKDLSRMQKDEQIRNSAIVTSITVNLSAVKMPPPSPPIKQEDQNSSKMTLTELKAAINRFMRDNRQDKRMLKEAFPVFSSPYSECKTAMRQVRQLEKNAGKWDELYHATSVGQAELLKQERQRQAKKLEELEAEDEAWKEAHR